MGEIKLFTGGARSGKSSAAQAEAKKYGDVAYIATAVATDSEMKERIERHRVSRPQSWKTLECPYDIAGALINTSHEAYLIDCITVYVNNLIFEIKQDWAQDELLDAHDIARIEESVLAKIDALIEAMKAREAVFIVVSNEVGSGVAPHYSLGRLFRDLAGMLNQRLARAAKEVYLTVSGIAVKIKGQ